MKTLSKLLIPFLYLVLTSFISPEEARIWEKFMDTGDYADYVLTTDYWERGDIHRTSMVSGATLSMDVFRRGTNGAPTTFYWHYVPKSSNTVEIEIKHGNDPKIVYTIKNAYVYKRKYKDTAKGNEGVTLYYVQRGADVLMIFATIPGNLYDFRLNKEKLSLYNTR